MSSSNVLILGGDLLVFRVCDELVASGARVAIIAPPDEGTAAAARSSGAVFVGTRGDERIALRDAGVVDANVAMALTEDDHANLQFALAARELNPRIRLVLRQFNRTLGLKIEDSLPNCSVISLSSLSAATYAAAALDRDYLYGVQFPYAGGRLVGIARRTAADAGVVGQTPIEAEQRLDARILGCNGSKSFEPTRPFVDGDVFDVFSQVHPRERAARRPGVRGISIGARRALRTFTGRVLRPDPIVRGAIVAAVGVIVAATLFFALVMHLDPMSAAYFVFSTMTTTGYGDITPPRGDVRAEAGAMVLMLAGLTFSGIFIAVLSSRFTQAQYVATQGLRRVSLRDHIVVCGAGNVGSRVIEYLAKADSKVVVVELTPRQDMIERARDGEFQLLTGDASRERTLDFCNVSEAAAVIAITNSDTMNLEVALGVRARNPAASIVMRVQHRHFETAVRNQFGFDRVFGTAALAAPVFAGLAYDPGVRGHVELESDSFAIAELRGPANAERHARYADSVPLAVWRDGRVLMLHNMADASADELVLVLSPVR